MNNHAYIELTDIINSEADCLDGLAEEQKRFAEAVAKRDWTGLQFVMGRLRENSERLAEVESHRYTLWNNVRSSSGLSEEAGITRVLLQMPEPERTKLSDAVRRLKVSVLRARVEGAAVGEFVTSAAGTLKSVIEELYPDQKGRIYGRSGHAVEAGSRPIVLDTAL
jgi:hypothetical protein